MSFMTDLFEGNFSNLGTDISHSGSSLINHPSEMWEVGGGLAAAATGGLALGALPGLGAAEAALPAIAEVGADVLPATSAVAEGTMDTSAFFGAGASSPWSLAGAGAVDPAAMASYGGAEGATGALGSAGAALPPDPFGGANVTGLMGPGGGAAAPPAEPGFFSGITKSLMHPTLPGVAQGAGVLAGAAGLGMNMMHGNTMDPNQQKLQELAGQLGQQGQTLEHYLKTGKLPPALKAQLDQAKAAEKARVMSRFPAGSTPANNSQMAAELNAIDTNAVAAMAQVQVEMMNTGLKETGMSMELYKILTTLDMQQNKDLMDSIMKFAGALSGGSGGAPRPA